MNNIIKKTTWEEVRDEVLGVNKTLGAHIDHLSPGKELPLFRVRYRFGQMIFEGNRLVLSQTSAAVALREALSYRTIPIGILLNRSAEIYIELAERIIPLSVLGPGGVFGLWEAFEPAESGYKDIGWSISAGSRSVFSLAKLNDATGLSRLMKRYSIRQYHIRKLKDQWHLFKNMLSGSQQDDDWYCDVLYFSKEWFDHLQQDSAWEGVKHYFYQLIWKQTMSMRRDVSQSLIWQQFSINIKKKRLRCSSYQLHSLKHLIQMGMGVLPCFQPVVDENALPVHQLQSMLVDDYGLDYIPTIMHADHYDMSQSNNVGYYSINEPTLINSVIYTRKIDNIMQVSREIKLLLLFLYREVESGNLDVTSTLMHELITKVRFEVFHNEYDASQLLKMSSQLPNYDARLTFCDHHQASLLPFCYASSFTRGCIRFIS
jgi:hypothetical protein